MKILKAFPHGMRTDMFCNVIKDFIGIDPTKPSRTNLGNNNNNPNNKLKLEDELMQELKKNVSKVDFHHNQQLFRLKIYDGKRTWLVCYTYLWRVFLSVCVCVCVRVFISVFVSAVCVCIVAGVLYFF